MNDQLSQDIASLRIDRSRRSNTRRGGGRWLVGALVAVGLGVAGWQLSKRTSQAIDVQPVELGSVTKAVDTTGGKLVSASGYVTARAETKLAVAAHGRVIKAHVVEGDLVKVDQLLLELDATDQKTAADAASTKIDVARARAAAAKAQLEELELQIGRQRVLVEKKVKGKAVLEDLEARAKAQRKTYHAALAESRSAAADARTIRVRLRGTKLESPIGGTIVSRVPRVGETVSPSGPFIEIVDLSSLVVETDVPEGKLHLVDEPGTPCEVVLEAYPDKRFKCETKSVGSRVDRAKATVPVRVVFTEPAERVLPNMSATVTFLEAAKEDAPKGAVRVSESAVTERAGEKVVFVVEGGIARRTPVELGERVGTEVMLLAGPSAGSRVVLRPSADLADLSKVKARTDE